MWYLLGNDNFGKGQENFSLIQLPALPRQNGGKSSEAHIGDPQFSRSSGTLPGALYDFTNYSTTLETYDRRLFATSHNTNTHTVSLRCLPEPSILSLLAGSWLRSAELSTSEQVQTRASSLQLLKLSTRAEYVNANEDSQNLELT